MLGAGYITAARRPLDWMCQLGHQVWFMGTHDPYKEQLVPNYTFVDFPAEHAKQQADHDKVTKTTPAIYAQGVAQLRAVVEREGIEVIHAHFSNFGAYCCALGGLKPLVVSIWGNFNDLLADRTLQIPLKLCMILGDATELIIATPP